MADSITAKILRYDPSVDSAPEYVTYEVPWVDDGTGFMTGLQVLHMINRDIEEIGYDYCCRSSLCGRCSMLIDGKPCLACWKALEPGEHTFEPLSQFPVIKDLVVDRERAYARFVNVNSTIQTIDPIDHPKDIEYDLYWNTLERINMCRECMCCYENCLAINAENGWKDYIGPGAMMGIAQRYLDGEDQSDRLMQAVLSGLFKCQECSTCTNVCSSNIKIKEVIVQMKADARARGLEPKA